MAKNNVKANPADEKWARRSWKPFLWMVIGGTVIAVVGIVLFFIAPFAATNPGITESEAAAIALGFFIPGYILAGIGGVVADGGVVLLIITAIKSNKAKARLGLKK